MYCHIMYTILISIWTIMYMHILLVFPYSVNLPFTYTLYMVKGNIYCWSTIKLLTINFVKQNHAYHLRCNNFITLWIHYIVHVIAVMRILLHITLLKWYIVITVTIIILLKKYTVIPIILLKWHIVITVITYHILKIVQK